MEEEAGIVTPGTYRSGMSRASTSKLNLLDGYSNVMQD
jgi:hypothetical protein